MRLVRASWLILIAVIIITAAVPALRHLPRIGLYGLVSGKDIVQQLDARIQTTLKSYLEDAAAFVEEQYPNDAEMLLAAGVLTDDADFLKRAAETGNTPVAWAVYVEFLMKDAPAFERMGSSGVNPADAEAVAEEEKRLAESIFPDRLTPEQADPILAALRSWQDADPENALPLALEARMLYGLHQDRDALAAWSRAGRMPLVTAHAIDCAKAVERLLVAMGMPRPEAIVNSNLWPAFRSFALLRDTARIAIYEGRLAAMRDDPVTAITCWQSTADFGRHMQDSTDSIIGFLVGVAIEGIGVHPVWRWVHDDRSGIPGGPILGCRYFWGEQHALYVGHMGEANDQALLDSRILSKLQIRAIREYTSGDLGMFEAYFTAARHLAVAATIVALGVLLFVIFLAVGAWSRRAADSATTLRPFWQLVLAALLLTPLVVSNVIIFRRPVSEPSSAATATAPLIAGFAGLLVLLLLIPPLAAIATRTPGARFRTAWRGNLRRILPVSIALCALLFLGLSAYTAHLRAQWVAKCSAPGVTEMSDMIQTLGDSWHNPTIPPDAYRAQYPPERPPEGPCSAGACLLPPPRTSHPLPASN